MLNHRERPKPRRGELERLPQRHSTFPPQYYILSDDSSVEVGVVT